MAEAPATPVVSQKGAQVGDENLAPAEAPQHVVVNEEQDARVTPEREAPAATQTYETHVVMDRVVTDPSSPEAVQVPDAGRGEINLPAYHLDARSPEQVFADSDK